MTFACKVKTIKQDYITFVKYCQHKIPKDVELFNELIFTKKRKLINSIPSYSTHGQNPWIAKLVNWKKII